MPTRSRWSIDIPRVDLHTFLFTSPTHPLPSIPIYLDTTDPSYLQLSLSSLRLWSQRLAAGLKARGLQQGDRVLLFSGNTIFFPVVLHGVIMAGGIFTGANPTYMPTELAYQLQNSGAKYLICADAALETGLEAARQVGLAEDSVFVFDEGYATLEGTGTGRLGCAHWTRLLADEANGSAFTWETGEHLIHRTTTLNYSSGTTGLPKGVEITHYNYIANCLTHMHLDRIRSTFDPARERWLGMAPMYHAMAQTIYCVGALHLQVPIYVMRQFSLRAMLEAVQSFRITKLALVPPMVVMMAKSPETRRWDLSSVLTVTSGAAPLGRPVSEEFERLWPPGRINLQQGYGMTEVTCAAISWDPEQKSEDASVGEPMPNVEVMLVDRQGKEVVEVGPEGTGELWLRAPNVMKGYWANPEATKNTITPEGWLKTGDVAFKDVHGRYHIVDRVKELIKVNAFQVAPAELEAQLLDHPAIADACVVGVTIDGGERPRAYIVPAQGQKAPTPEDVAQYIAKKLSRHKHLTGGVKVVEDIKKNPSGKLLRKFYRELAQKEANEDAGSSGIVMAKL